MDTKHGSGSVLIVRIIFAQVGDGPDLRFVEVEDANGRGVKVGTWSVDKDGSHALTLDIADSGQRHEPRDQGHGEAR